MADPAELVALARRWLSCFTTHDLDTLVSLYAPDARHFSPKLRARRPETNGLVVGRDALREWWGDAFQRIPGLRYEEVTLTADETRVWMEYRRHAPGEPEMMVAEVLEVRDGLIAASRVYHG